MKINREDIPLTAALAFAAGCVGASAQLGYFSQVGEQFVTLAGINDWLFAVVTAFPMAMLIQVIAMRLFLPQPPERIWIVLAIALGMTGQIISLIYAPVHAYTLRMVTLALTILAFIYWLASDVHRLRDAREFSISDFFFALLKTCCAIYLSATMFAIMPHKNPKCAVVMTASQVERTYNSVDYLRHVSGGHLVRVDEIVHFVPDDQVREIICNLPTENNPGQVSSAGR